MTHDEQTNLASDIRSGLQARAAVRNAEVPRPDILSEQAPADPKRLPGWKALRDQTEAEYVQRLLDKCSLTPDEQLFLSRAINEHISQGR